eukprot:2256752-Rhodomonas_salina.1
MESLCSATFAAAITTFGLANLVKVAPFAMKRWLPFVVARMLALTLPARGSRVCAGLGLHLGLILAADQAPAPGTTP